MSENADTFGERLRRRRQERFVGRDREVDTFVRAALNARSPRHNIFVFTGVGGIGKTALLAKLRELARLRPAQVTTATLETAHSPLDLMRAWREELDPAAFRAFDKELARYSTVSSKLHAGAGSVSHGAFRALENTGVVGAFIAGTIGEERLRGFLSQYLTGRESNIYIDGPGRLTTAFIAGLNRTAATARLFLFLDYYEGVTADTDGWLRRLLASELSTEAVLVLAGRDPPERMDRRWTDFRPMTYLSELLPFADREADEYLVRASVTDPQLRDQLKTFAGGLPWALELLVEGLAHARTKAEFAAEVHEVQSKVVGRLLSQLESEGRLRDIVEAACVLGTFDVDALCALIDTPTTAEQDQLVRYSFVMRRPDGEYAVKEVVRETINNLTRQHSRQRWLDLHERSAAYYGTLVAREKVFGAAWQRSFTERIRHIVHSAPERAVAELMNAVQGIPPHVWMNPCAGALALVAAHPETMTDSWVLLLQGDSARAAGNLDTAQKFYQAAVDGVAAPDLQLRAIANLIEIRHRIGDVRKALQTAVDGYRRAVVEQMDLHVAMFSARVAEMYGVLGDQERSDRYCAIAVGKSGEFSAVSTEGLVAGQIGLVLVYMLTFAGRYTEAKEQLNTTMQCWREVGYEFGVAQAESAQAWLGWLTGMLAAGMLAGRSAYRYFHKIRDTYHVGVVCLNLGELYRLAGDYPKAMSYLHDAHTCLSKTRGVVYLPITLYRLGHTYLNLGELEQAVRLLESAVQIERDEVSEPYSLGMALLLLAEAYQRTGDPRAEATLAEAERILLSAQNRHGRALALAVSAALGGGIDTVENVGRRLAEAMSASREYGYFDIQANVWLTRARLSVVDGPHDGVAMGTFLGQALVAAVLHSPYLADAVFRDGRAILAECPESVRSTAASIMAQVFRADAHAAMTDRARRANEAWPTLGHPIDDLL